MLRLYNSFKGNFADLITSTVSSKESITSEGNDYNKCAPKVSWSPPVKTKRQPNMVPMKTAKDFIPFVIVKKSIIDDVDSEVKKSTHKVNENLQNDIDQGSSEYHKNNKAKCRSHKIVKNALSTTKKHSCPSCGSSQTSQWRVIVGSVHCNACYAKLRRWIIKNNKNIHSQGDVIEGFQSLAMHMKNNPL